MAYTSGNNDIIGATCNGCGAPLKARPTYNSPIRCDYCDLMNYMRRDVRVAATTSAEITEEEESERYYMIYQQTQKILENFPGEIVGDEIGKIRMKIQIGRYAFPLLVVLDELPERPYIDGPSELRELIGLELNELDTMKNWLPGESEPLDVIEEIYERARKALEKESAAETTITEQPKIDNPLLQAILDNFDAELVSNKKVKVRFFSPDGSVIELFIKKKKNFPVEVDSNILVRFPLIRGSLEDYAKGRIDLIQALSEIERSLYK